MIKDGVSDQLFPKRILRKLRQNENIVQPEKNQVINYIKTCRRQLFGESKITLQQFIDYCKKNENIPEELDKAFVLAYEHSPLDSELNENDGFEEFDVIVLFENYERENVVDIAVSPIWIRFVVTTKRLLMESCKSRTIHADATHKMVIQKYPILVFGTTDYDTQQHFHLSFIMVTKNETANDFAFAFRAMKEGMMKIINFDFKPEYVMADAAAQIHNGAVSVFGDGIVVLMCYAHMMRVVDRVKNIKSKDNKEKIKKDLRQLRLAYYTDVFQRGSILFLNKWRPTEPDFVEYFASFWLNRNAKWFNGAGIRVPTTKML